MELMRKLAMLFRGKRFHNDLAEEMRLHLELREAELRAEGMSPDEARLAARRQFGNPTVLAETSRDGWGWSWLSSLAQDLRYSLRTMLRNPGFTAVAALALALGIGANTAIFSVVNAVLLRPLPYAEDDRLAVILHAGQWPVAPGNFFDWRAQAKSFQGMGAAELWSANLAGVTNPEQLKAIRVTGDMFPLLGVAPILGRTFGPGEDEPGQDHVVVLGHGLWKRRFAADPDIVGKKMTLNGESYTVAGVMPRGFRFAPFWATDAELWAPLSFVDKANRERSSLRVFARLAPGVSLEQARAEMATISGHLEQQYPGTNRDVTVVALREKVVGSIRPALLVLVGAVAFVLLIACANIAHMLLARAAARQREVALRVALGASRGRMIRQLLTESLLLAVLGGGAGLLLAVWGVQALTSLSALDIPRLETVGVDGRVLAFMLGVSLVAGIAFGLAPAMQASAVDLTAALKDGGRGSSEGAGRGRLRKLLLVSQVALTLMLLVGAGLMIRTFVALRAIDPGFDPRHVLSLVVSVTGSPEAAPGRRATFFPQLVGRIESLPGVESASAINHLPLAGDLWGLSYWVEGRPIPPPGEAARAAYRVVLPGYFRTMNIPVGRGRDIAAPDAAGTSSVVVINEHLAKEQWPGEDPIGKRITMDDPSDPSSWMTVVGVVKDARQLRWADPIGNEVYLPYLQSPKYLDDISPARTYLTLVVRTVGDPAAIAPAVRREIAALDPSVVVSQVQTMETVVAEANAQARLYLILLAAFAGVALVLAVVGIYGVMSYAVSRRTQEIGIRMALGAQRGEVLRMIVGQGLTLALIGAAVGVVGALALTRLMTTLLYGVTAIDPITFVVVALFLSAVALVATYLPARRATQVDPMLALRGD